MKIGAQLQAARMAQHLTQQQVADTVHVARQTISSWETSHSYPDIASLIALSDLFAVSLDTLLKGDEQLQVELARQATLLRRVRQLGWACLAIDLLLGVALIGNLANWSDFELGLWPVVIVDGVIAINCGLIVVLMRWQHQLRRLPKIAPWVRNWFIAAIVGEVMIEIARRLGQWASTVDQIVTWIYAIGVGMAFYGYARWRIHRHKS